jgi:hypothetical protein
MRANARILCLSTPIFPRDPKCPLPGFADKKNKKLRYRGNRHYSSRRARRYATVLRTNYNALVPMNRLPVVRYVQRTELRVCATISHALIAIVTFLLFVPTNPYFEINNRVYPRTSTDNGSVRPRAL